MANYVNLNGAACEVAGDFLKEGDTAPRFSLVRGDLREFVFGGKPEARLVLNIFPSIDTGVCAMSVRRFNALAAGIPNTKVLCVSKDLPFAQSRFCAAEGIKNVEVLSDFRGSFASDYGVLIAGGALKGLMARAIVIIGKDGKVSYSALNSEIAQEPDYEAALNALKASE